MVSGCDREFKAHSHCTALLCYHVSDTWQEISSSHAILTLALSRKSERQAWLVLRVVFWFGLMLNVPVNNFTVMLGWSHRFLGITSTFGG